MDSSQQFAFFDAVSELTERAGPNTSVDGLMQAAVEIIRSHTAADRAMVYIVDVTSREPEERVWTHGKGSEPDNESLLRVARDVHVTGEMREYRGASMESEVQVALVAVPLRRGPQRLGSIVAAGEEILPGVSRVLRTVASQIALVLENSLLLSLVPEPAPDTEQAELPSVIYGDQAAPGMAAGESLVWDASIEEMKDTETHITGEDARQQLSGAIERTRSQLESLKHTGSSDVDDMVATLFDAHILMLADNRFSGAMLDLVSKGHTAEQAIRDVVNNFVSIFSGMQDPRLAEKAQDIQDLGLRILRNLRDPDRSWEDYGGRVVIAREMYPSELVALSAQQIEGVVFLGAGLTAHLSILARSLELPALMVQDRRLLAIGNGVQLLLDANGGRLLVNPDEDEREQVEKREAERIDAIRLDGDTRDAAGKAAKQSREKTGLRALANVNLFHDAERASYLGAAGIGLYRSEFPFIIRSDYISEDEQVRIYRRIVETFSGKPITFRTADIGGDKILPWIGEREANPFLGVRGIRFSLSNRQMFRDQLRAMLRAGAGEDLGIMFPMVSTLEEIHAAKEELHRCLGELEREDLPHLNSPRLGAMIELPLAVEAVEDLAGELDFLSIGTNDLVMYLLAVDRTNGRLSELYRTYHPTVLRIIARIAEAVQSSRVNREREKPITLSVCGDSAADPVMLPFYLGLGITDLSVAPDRLMTLHRHAANLDREHITRIRDTMLGIRLLADMDRYVSSIREELEAGVKCQA